MSNGRRLIRSNEVRRALRSSRAKIDQPSRRAPAIVSPRRAWPAPPSARNESKSQNQVKQTLLET